MFDRINKFINKEKFIINKTKKLLIKINNIENNIKSKNRNELLEIILDIKNQLKNKDYNTNSLLYNNTVIIIFAIVREAGFRMLNERQFDMQIIAGLCLNECSIIEMKTGQGKTLTCVSSAIYRSLYNHKVHVLTANDYLAKRDYEWMKPIYDYLNILVDYVIKEKTENMKKNAYEKGVTYISNHEIGFDFLRSNMKYNKNQIILDEENLEHVIVDEADSILIDNARIPIIIGNSVNTNTDMYFKIANKIVFELFDDEIVINLKDKDVYLNEYGISKVEKLITEYFRITNQEIYNKNNLNILFYIDRALKARYIFRRNYDYIVFNLKVFIIDEYTGRIADDRKFSGGIQQAIEAKEGVNITSESIQVNYITTQTIYRKYKYLSGMTGTAYTERKEIEVIYNVPVVRIKKEENDNVIYHRDLFFKTKNGKYEAIAKQVIQCVYKNQPVLIGTSSIQDSEEISNILQNYNIEHNILNAKKISKEADIISDAGMPGKITIATNVAGRGTDIKLGGNIQNMIKKELELYNVVSEDIKKEVSEKVNKQYKEFKKISENAGGLFVIISQKQENRRIDNQFKGRTGRRKDKGEIQFYISISDDIFKNSKSQKIASLFLDGDYGEYSFVLENLVTRLQKQIEKIMFDSRISVLNQDHMLNKSREIFFDIRKKILKDEIDFHATFDNIINSIINEYNTENKINKKIYKNFLLQYIDDKIEDRIDNAILIEQINKTKLEIINKNILTKKYEDIKISFLKGIDKLWSDFINSREISRRTSVFKNKIDYILDHNKQICELFEKIFIEYTCVFLSSIHFHYINDINNDSII